MVRVSVILTIIVSVITLAMIVNAYNTLLAINSFYEDVLKIETNTNIEEFRTTAMITIIGVGILISSVIFHGKKQIILMAIGTAIIAMNLSLTSIISVLLLIIAMLLAYRESHKELKGVKYDV